MTDDEQKRLKELEDAKKHKAIFQGVMLVIVLGLMIYLMVG